MNLKKLRKELINFSQFEQAIICLLIVCFFHFFLFFSPLLIEEASAKEADIVSLNSITKSDGLDLEVLIFLESNALIKHNYPILSSNEEIIESNEEIVLEWLQEAKEREMVRVLRTSVHAITAYNSLPEQTNDQPCITANGFNVCKHGIEDTIAANFLRFGTKVRIPDLFGDRIFIVRDRMNQRYPDRVDIWMLERDDAIQFGIRRARIEIVELIN
jgi:3D (Asp-Asp-Asp) domain-containing protein